MISPDRRPHPAMIEFKKCAQPVDFQCSWSGDGKLELRIVNNRYFTTLDNITVLWTLRVNGFIVETKALAFSRVLPQNSAEVDGSSILQALVDHNVQRFISGGETEIHLDFSASITEATGERIEIASDQITLSSQGKELSYPKHLILCQNNDEGELVKVEPDSLSLSANGFRISLVDGSFNYHSVTDSAKPIVSGLQPNLFRAGTDNDGVKQLGDHFFDKSKPLGLWSTLGLDYTTLENIEAVLSSKKINLSGDAMDFPSVVTKASIFGHPGRRKYDGISLAKKLDVCSASPVKLGKWEQQVTMVGNGSIYVEVVLDLEESLKDLPRVGLQFVSPGMGKACFFSNGPHENYIDRQYSAHAGVYEMDVPSCLDTYVVPQEQGNRTGLRWL